MTGFETGQEVYVCSNADCRAVWTADPQGHCPRCLYGTGWSTMRRRVLSTTPLEPKPQFVFFVVERYQHETLVFWHPSGWAEKIGDAVKFHDRDSANYVLTRLCDGVGRSVEHMMVSP